jgi:hypothetical protein
VVVAVLLCGAGISGLALLIQQNSSDSERRSNSANQGEASSQAPTDSPSDPSSESPSASPSRSRGDVSSRVADPRPLTAAEVFPHAFESNAGRTYARLKTEVSSSCSGSAYGITAALLNAEGCTQIVRATFVDNTRTFVATVGIANLPDEASANRIATSLRTPDTGAFTPLRVPGTAAANFDFTSGTYVSWQIRGHYVVYADVARADSRSASQSDPAVQLVGTNLRRVVLIAIIKRELGY